MTYDPFRSLVRAEGVRLYRDFSWRRTQDPYAIWLSEVMLQQTQVGRVEERMPAWLQKFPTVEALAAASTADVLAAWQGMGYNRRALALHKAAQTVVAEYDGVFPRGTKELVALPGIGPATAQGIRAFAFNLPGVYLETNVRTVFLHHFFPDAEGVSDKELVPLIEASCPGAPGVLDMPREGCGSGAPFAPVGAQGVVAGSAVSQQLAGPCAAEGALGERDSASGPSVYAAPQDAGDTPRAWYYALLDYGAYLKKTIPNPSRRSRSYAKQSKFEGSRRQKRAEVVRLLLAAHEQNKLLSAEEVLAGLNDFELSAGRSAVDETLVVSILGDLEREGFCSYRAPGWGVL